MMSLILTAALAAVGDVPVAPQGAFKATPKTFASFSTPNNAYSYYGMSESTSYYGGYDYAAGGCRGGCCPTDDVNLFFPCAPAGPCAPFAPPSVRPICAPRVNTFPCPTPIRNCPCPPPPRQAPCD